MLLPAILLTLLATILGIEEMCGQFGFSSPICAGVITGIFLGDIKTGVLVGAQLQLVFMGTIGIGAAVPPNPLVGTIIATAFAILSNAGIEVALALAVPVAVAGQALDILGRTFCSFLQHAADRFAKASSYGKVDLIHYSAALVYLVRMILIIFPAVYFGVEVVESIVAVIPPQILRGLEVSGGILPAVGFAMLLTMLNIPYLFPFFFVGFALAIFGGFSTVGVTMVAVCIALVLDHYNKDKYTAKSQPIDDLDALMKD
jgi:mannose/fructose/N-acetylgalactosamine-specific phosphotransferase system component IIC